MTYDSYESLANSELLEGDSILFSEKIRLEVRKGIWSRRFYLSRPTPNVIQTADGKKNLLEILGFNNVLEFDQFFGLTVPELPPKMYGTDKNSVDIPLSKPNLKELKELVLNIFDLIETPEKLKETSEILFID